MYHMTHVEIAKNLKDLDLLITTPTETKDLPLHFYNEFDRTAFHPEKR